MKVAGERGFALLVVLWSLVLISLLTMQVLASGRTAIELADNVRAGAEAQARADGAINEALFHLFSGGMDHWSADGTTHVLGTAGGPIYVQIRLLDDKINPNLASAALLAGLFQSCGGTKAQALHLADAIIQWRSTPGSQQAERAALAQYRQAGLAYGPPGRRFNDLSELSGIASMSPALHALALPHMSLYQPFDPDPAYADPVVRQALKISGQPGTNINVYLGAAPVISIEAGVAGPGKVAVRRSAIVNIGVGGEPYRFLSLTDRD
jgi:general secretion pathway protein K